MADRRDRGIVCVCVYFARLVFPLFDNNTCQRRDTYQRRDTCQHPDTTNATGVSYRSRRVPPPPRGRPDWQKQPPYIDTFTNVYKVNQKPSYLQYIFIMFIN